MKIYVINVERYLPDEDAKKAEEYFVKKLMALGIENPKVLILPPGARFSVEEI